MSKEHLFVRLEMWVEENEEGQPCGVRYSYDLPDIENEMIMDLYKIFLESLCSEIAQVKGAENILDLLVIREEKDYENKS